MIFLLLNFFIILLNYNYIYYNEDLLLNLFLILFFFLLFLLLKKNIKNYYFFYISKTFYIFRLLIQLVYYYNNEYKVFNIFKSKFIYIFLLGLKTFRKRIARLLTHLYGVNIYMIRLLYYFLDLLDYELIKNFNIPLLYCISPKLKYYDMCFFFFY